MSLAGAGQQQQRAMDAVAPEIPALCPDVRMRPPELALEGRRRAGAFPAVPGGVESAVRLPARWAWVPARLTMVLLMGGV